jgi:hypothetical protein
MTKKFTYFYSPYLVNCYVPTKKPTPVSEPSTNINKETDGALTDKDKGFLEVEDVRVPAATVTSNGTDAATKKRVASNELNIISGTVYIGCRFEDLLLLQNSTYLILGLTTVSSLPPELAGVTMLTLRDYKDAASLGALGEISISLVPETSGKVNIVWGNRYNTRLPFSRQIDLRTVSLQLLTYTFKYNGDDAIYRIEPGSIRELTSRKTKPRIA